MTQKKLAEKGAEQIKEYLASSKEDAIQKDFDEDAMQMADRQDEQESNLWKTDPSKQEAGLISPIDSVLEFTGVSSLGSAFDSVGSAFKGDYLGAGIEGLAAMVGAVPIVGSKLKKPLKDALGSSKIAVERGDIGVSEALMGGTFLKQYGKDVISRMDTLAVNASVKNGSGKMFQPVADGTRVGVRLNLNSVVPDAPKGLDKLQTIHKKSFSGEVLSYQPYATVTDVTFKVSPAKRRNIAAKIKGLKVKEVEHKNPAMSVNGLLAQTENVVIKGGKNVTEIGFNPMNNHLFIDMLTGQAVKSADVATVIGDRVYAKGVKYWEKKYAPKVMDASDGTPLPSEVRYKFNRGGLVEEMNALNFNEGGLPVKDENYGVAFIKKLMDEKRKKQERLARKTEAQAAKAAKEAKINSELSNQPTPAISVSTQDKELIKIEEPNPLVNKKVNQEPIETNIEVPVYKYSEKPWDNVLSDTFSDIVDEGKDVLRGIRDTGSSIYGTLKEAGRDIEVDYEEYMFEREMNKLVDPEINSISTPTIPIETEDETITNAVHKSIRREENGTRDGWDNFGSPNMWMPHDSVEGGPQTIGYGHKFATQAEADKIAKSGGITEAKAMQWFKEDMINAESRAKANYEKEYKDREWSSLNTLDKLMLTEIAFNIGDLLKKKEPNAGEYDWPKLTKAIHEKDYDTALSELSRTYEKNGKVVPLKDRVRRLKETYRDLINDPTQMATGKGVDKTVYKELIG